MNDRTGDARPYDPATDGPLISAYLDGELDAADHARVEGWLADDARAREELQRLQELEAFTGHLQLRQPPSESWEDFHRRLYNRSERGLGWALLLAGVGVVGLYGLLRLSSLLLTAALPLIVRLGVLAVGLGLLILAVSALRERLFTRKRDRYDDVVR
jgi:anti-sigma factor RsiW